MPRRLQGDRRPPTRSRPMPPFMVGGALARAQPKGLGSTPLPTRLGLDNPGAVTVVEEGMSTR
jgi:hypothetical protein